MHEDITFGPTIIFFGLYVFFMALLYCGKDKTKILVLNVLTCGFGGIYLFSMDSMAGVVACAAAALGSLCQILLERYCADMASFKLLLAKTIGCVVFATIGILAVYNHISDLYLVVAIVSCRASEMLKKQEHVRIGYMFAEVLWLHYAIVNGLVLFAAVHTIMTGFGLFILLSPDFKAAFLWMRMSTQSIRIGLWRQQM